MRVASLFVLLSACTSCANGKSPVTDTKFPTLTVKLDNDNSPPDAGQGPFRPANVKRWVPLIRFSADVDSESSAAFVRAINVSNDLHADAIIVEINSPGGAVDSGWDMMRAIERSKAPVACVVDGEAASMAFLVLQSCDMRFMTKRSVLMAHEISMARPASGTPNAWKSYYDYIHAMQEAIIIQYTYRTNISIDEMRQKIDGNRQWWLNWEEAKTREVVDGVVITPEELYLVLSKEPTK